MAQSDLDILNELLDEDFSEIDFDSKYDNQVDQKSEAQPAEVSGDKSSECVENKKSLTFIDILTKDSEEPVSSTKQEKSLIHTGDTDSSDDEDNKYFENTNYNAFGKSVKKLLKNESDTLSNAPRAESGQWMTTTKPPVHHKPVKQLSLPERTEPKKADVYADPCFGIRLLNPLISSARLQARMEGKKTVSLSNLKLHLSKKNFSHTDWVTAGAITRSIPKTSQNGNQYMIWEISDLKEDLAVVSVFLFGSTYTDLWKTSVGTVVGLLNPAPSNKNEKSNLSLSLKSPDQVMIWGMAKDYGTCKSFKKSGEKCTAFVNVRLCEYCIYHVQKEYRKYSGRSELQSPSCADRNFLRNKVLGKNEVFYGGKSFSSLKSPPVKKLNPKDKKRISSLGPAVRLPSPPRTYTPAPCNRGTEAFRRLSVSLPGLKIPSTNTSEKERSLLEKLSSPNNMAKSSTIQTDTSEQVAKKHPPLKLSDPEKNENCNQVRSRFEKLNDVEKSPKTIKHFFSDKSQEISSPKLSNPELNDSDDQLEFTSDSRKTKSPTIPKLEKLNKEQAKRVDSKTEHQNKLSNTKLKGNKSKEAKSHDQGRKKMESLSSGDINVREKTNIPTLSNPESWSPPDTSGNGVALLKSQTTPKAQNLPVRTSTPNSEQKTVSKTKKSLQKTFNSLLQVQSQNKQVSKSELPTLNEDAMKEHSMARLPETKLENAMKENSTARLPESKLENANQRPMVAASPSQMSRAKLKALQVIKNQGVNPKNSQKRPREEETDKIEMSEVFKELLKKGADAIRWDLVDKVKRAEEEKYFDKMEYKEQLEEKMLSTYKVECKAVKCIKCKYIWFSASDVCKSEGHPIKVIDAVKRFFKCGNCSNRTVSLHITPLINCKNCQSSNWVRAPMIREKIIKNPNELSIRGGEQQFVNSVMSNANLNLLIPESTE